MGMPLFLAPRETPLKIERIALRDEKLSYRLAELGLSPETEIELLSSNSEGGAVVLVKGTRLALDRDITRSIFVA